MRLEVTVERAMVLVAAALGQNVDHAAKGLAILGLKATRLDLNLLDEVEIHAVSKRSKNAAVGAETTEAGVGHVSAVDDILIFQARSPINGWICRSRCAAIGYAWSHGDH